MPPQREALFQPRPREEILIGLDTEAETRADLDGYDPSQRAEILEAMSDGPVDGLIQVELLPDED